MSGNTLKKASPRRLYQLGKIFMFLLAIGLTTTSFAQQSATDLKTVKGTVVDETNQPIPGATILVQNSTRGVVTDELGKFEITVLPSDKLVISFIGLETKTIPIGDKTTLSIVLLPKANELDGVTVVAFAKQKKESVVGAITTVTPKDLKVPSSNLTTALAGRVAGMISYQTSGEPGADNAQFFIRGIGTFGSSAKKDPLILIDNLEVSATDLARLQPDDIASFSIMKDATAAALYGSRGANGVILVTTKEGAEGKAKLSIRFETSLSQPTRQVKLADPVTYMRMHNEATLARTPENPLPYSEEKIANTLAGKNPMVYPAVDWQDILFKNFAVNERLNFNLSGGGKVARYYISGTYNKDNGILRENGKNNFNSNISLANYALRSNININVTPTTEVIVRLSGQFDDYTGPLEGGQRVYLETMNANPVLFPAEYLPDKANQRAKQILFGNYTGGTYLNPYANMVKGYKEYANSTMMAQFELKQKLDFFTKGLELRAMFNTQRYSYFENKRQYTPYYYMIDVYDKENDIYTLKSLNEGSMALGYDPSYKTVSSSIYMEAAANYNRTFDEKHDVGGLLVYTMQNKRSGNESDLQKSLPHRNMGLAGRFTYGYDSRYFMEFNFGLNGSERFAKKERWGFFPSIGLGWMISNEAFWPESMQRIMPKLKVRGSYGLVGNDAIGSDDDRFYYLSNVNLNNSDRGATFGSSFGYNRPGYSISRYANEEISWEVSYKTNFAVEINLFNDLDIQAEWFREKRTNILMDRAMIPESMGLQATPKANVGEAKSWGSELELKYTKNFNNGMWLQGTGTFTYATNEYSCYEEAPRPETPWLNHKGEKINAHWGYLAERLFIDEYDINNSPTQVYGAQSILPGDIKYKDINGDGKVDSQDWVTIGWPSVPEIIYGFGFSAGYKGFDISCFFQGSAHSSFVFHTGGTDYGSGVSTLHPFVGGQTALMQAIADDHWTEENQDPYAFWPRLSTQIEENNSQKSTWWMRNGAFLRLKSAEIGYSLPKEVCRKLYLSNLRVYLSGTNLLTFSKFKLWDVEMGGNGLGYPIQRVYNVGVQLDF